MMIPVRTTSYAHVHHVPIQVLTLPIFSVIYLSLVLFNSDCHTSYMWLTLSAYRRLFFCFLFLILVSIVFLVHCKAYIIINNKEKEDDETRFSPLPGSSL